MGRWRSGAPLVLAPLKDDPALGADMQHTNNFDYGTMDPLGYACPVGSHIRRMNPRDTTQNMGRRRMIRRGGTYGPPLPEDAPEDGVQRGIAAFIGCASLVRQKDLDKRGWLANVTTFNFRPHLPHYALTITGAEPIHVLAQQPVDMSHPHPFTQAGNRVFNMFLWMPPSGGRSGDILMANSTIFTTLFGGDESLEHFWKNIATK